MATKFSFLAIAALLGFTSTASHGATVGTQNPIILNDVIDDDDGTQFVVSNGGVADDFPEPIFQENESFEMLNPTHVNGEELFESDIMLTPEQREAMAQRKAIISYAEYRWEIGTDGYPHVPYTFADSEVDQAAVEGGIAHWEEHTCIKFDNATDLTAPHLRFINDSGCWSYVGRIWFWPGQNISIGTGCTSLGTVAHEIGHAMGFFHEQSRNDRDSYIYIKTDNIVEGRESNFEKKADADVSNFSVPYDYSSNMHYGGTYFTKNGHLTIATIDPLAQELIGTRAGLSHRDKLLANRMYPCIEKWLADCGETSEPCQNDGYTGADCACVCPSGTTGSNCENVDGDYYDSALSGHSEVITSEKTITSPNYPDKYPSGLQVVKWIIAPECQLVQLTFCDFQLYRQTTCQNGEPCCYYDALEIRTSQYVEGEWFCDQMIPKGMTFTSDSNQMFLFFKTASDFYSGFSAIVQFIPDPKCTRTGTVPEAKAATCPSDTTTTTTPAPSNTEKCGVQSTNGVFYWTTPHFGEENYANDFKCSIAGRTSSPMAVQFEFQPMMLQKAKKRVCKDKVTISSTYGKEMEYCGKYENKKVLLPSFAFAAAFESDSDINKEGFNISITPIRTTCHLKINLTSLGDTGEFKTPSFPNLDEKKRMCEVWIFAPSPYHIQLEFLGFSLRKPCKKNNLVINPEGDHAYPVETSSRHCGKELPPTMVSTDNEIDLVYFSKKKSKGFSVKYTVVE